MPRRKNKQQSPPSQLPGWLVGTAVLLLLTGLGSSIYLTLLHLQVQAGGSEVQSFCAISKGFNCVTVATSEYAVFLGIPVAIYGLEFYVLALMAILLGGLGLWSVTRWDSLLFDALAFSLPVCGLLAWISVSCIQSVCIMCLLVYGVNLVLFGVLLVANRGRLGALVTAGPWQLLRMASGVRGGAGLLLVLALTVSQFFWLPGLLHGAPPIQAGASRAWHGMPAEGLSIGPADAPVQIEEFTDFECPYCGRAHEAMMQILKQFPGKIRLMHRDYPLDMACNPRMPQPFHRRACQAAYYARCAGAQGKYWPYEALVFGNREHLEHDDLLGHARQLGLDLTRMRECVRDERTFQAVRADLELGAQRKVHGTPTFFINGEMIVGVRPPEFWVKKIGELIQKGK